MENPYNQEFTRLAIITSKTELKILQEITILSHLRVIKVLINNLKFKVMTKKEILIVNCVLGKNCMDAPGWIYCLEHYDRVNLILFIYNFFRIDFDDSTSQAIKDTKRYISDDYDLQNDPHHLYLFWRDLYYWKLH